ncbi:MAG: glutathione synthase [Elainellaceae cyanobacterium]
MKFAFIIDPIDRLDPGHDTSVALMEAAQAAGHEVWMTEAKYLGVVDGKAEARLQQVMLNPVQLGNGRWVAPRPWYQLGDRAVTCLEELDAVFMRIDPPVNTAYLYATYILDYVDPTQTLVMNSTHGLRAANEKMYALRFQDLIPRTLVSQDKQVILEFVKEQGIAVLKPLGGKGGEGIFLIEARDRNFNSLIEVSTQYNQLPIIVQQYLPEAKDGDKRIILLNGEPIGAVNRIPTGSEFRGNMAVGGRVAEAAITERDRVICERLAPMLRQDGLYFVGIDVIGGYLTEVNVTSPTGIREIDRLNTVSLGAQVIDWVVEYCSKLTATSI